MRGRGDGLVREIEVLADAHVTLLADRRKFGPYVLQGGAEGAVGWPSIRDGSGESLPGKCRRRVSAGSTARIETSGGDGWAKVKQR
jgi:N-methylhydantoinase B